tara:strand:+ start:1133 stop:1894 length:762 start_codon:yes stop_codon:yes gene_type:complete
MKRQYIFKLENLLDIKKKSLEYGLISNIPKELLFLEILNFYESDSLNFIWLGRIHYNDAWDIQKKIHQLILQDKIKDTILFLEHFHVYTFGKNADQNHLLPSYNKQAEIIQSDRGGDITYHGPGQLVVYPVINLNKYKKSISWYINIIEQIIIDTLKEYNINANRKDGLTGVWVEEEKIAAIGVRLSKWITMHGFALNIKPDLSFYNGMIPCGIFEYGITSIFELSGIKIDSIDIVKNIIKQFSNNFIQNNEI